MSEKYHVIYTVKPAPQGVTQDEVPRGTNLCDDIVFLSFNTPPVAGKTNLIGSLSGKTNQPLSSLELFNAWMKMGYAIWENFHDLDERYKRVLDFTMASMKFWTGQSPLAPEEDPKA